VQFLGKFEALIETKKRIAVATFYVAKTTNSGNLISATTAQELGLISLNPNKVSTTKNNNLDKILNKPGTNNPADYLSRHPTSTSSKQASMTEDYINLIARCSRCSVPKTLTLDEVETATDSDKTLRGVRAAIKLNKWHYDLVKAFKPVKDELTVTSKGVVLRGTRIVLPHVVTRNISFFKRISKQTSIETDDDDDERCTATQNRANRNGNNTEHVDEPRGLRRSQRVRGKTVRFGQSVYD
jgi:hypothetical protein